MANSDNTDHEVFKDVPESLEDITPQWCEEVLRRGGQISPSTKVIGAEVKRLVSEETGALDGGGLTSAQIVRIKLTYEGKSEGYDSPDSIVAKCLMNGKLLFDVSLPYRILVYLLYGKNYEEQFWRNDILYSREAMPLINKCYSSPDVYYTGISDGGNRSFCHQVVNSRPHKVRSVSVMKDMQGWKSQIIGVNRLSLEEASAILKNVAQLHGSFWGEKNQSIKDKFRPSVSELEVRRSTHSKLHRMKRNAFSSSTRSIKKTTKKFLKNWDSHPWFCISKGASMPSWLSTAITDEPEDGDISIFKQPDVLEMLDVFAERFPEFSNEFNKPFLEMPSQTLLHGDFHNGNHMYQEDEDGVKVVAFDFQGVGYGAAISDVIKLLAYSKSHVSLAEEFDLVQRYHEALILTRTVEDYGYDEVKQHFIVAMTEVMVRMIVDYARQKPETLIKLLKSMFGEEKWNETQRIFGSGMHQTIFLMMTSMYLHNKDAFLKGSSFVKQF